MNRPVGPSLDRTFLAVIACFALSGFAALLYQTIWMRQFSIVFGTSELAIATVLAAYMGGLALGAMVAGRWVGTLKRPIAYYGLLELGVALGALLVPLGLLLAQSVHVAILGNQAELSDSGGVGTSLFYLLFGFVIIALPTAFMGATLPVLTRHAVRTSQQIGSRTGLLYAVNTAGAVAGALMCAFVLLPTLGLFGTTLVGVGINAIIFIIAIRLGPRSSTTQGASTTDATQTSPNPSAETTPTLKAFEGTGWILPLILTSGAVSFAYEILWTRLLAHIVGTSLYSFATMLATFLTGITIGSAVASRFCKSTTHARLGFLVAQLGTAVSALLVFKILDKVPSIAASLSAGEHASLFANAIVAALVLLPTTLFIGATFPFAVRLLARHSDEAAHAAARVYGWNTVGAIVGSVLTGFFLIPALEFSGTLLFAVTLNMLLALAALFLLGKPASRNVVLTVAALSVVSIFVLYPQRPDDLLRMSPVKGETAGRVIFTGVGASATVLCLESEGTFYLRTNGLPEALIAPRGGLPIGQQGNWWLGALPPLAHPEARSMLIIGFGGGVVIEGVPNSVESIDVIELEPKVIDANRVLSELRRSDPLKDPRVRIITNDARGALALTSKRYDIIISQPSHPWTAGASHLYTREFMEQIREHLTPQGVFCQGYLDAAILGTVGATLIDTFEHVSLYNPGSYLYLAAQRPLDIISDASGSAAVIAADRDHYRWLGIHRKEDLAATVVLDAAGVATFAADYSVITDDHNTLATAPPELIRERSSLDDRDPKLDALDPLVGPDSWVVKYQLPGVHLVQRLVNIGYRERALRVAESLTDPIEKLLAQAHLCAPTEGARRQQLLREAQQKGPRHADVAFAKLVARARTGGSLGDLSALGVAARSTVQALQLYASIQLEQQQSQKLSSRWPQLAALETGLAQAQAHEAAFELANAMRATWRVESPSDGATDGATDAAQQQLRAEEALQLIDNVIAMFPKDTHYSIRLRAGIAARRPFVILETAREITNFLAKVWQQMPPPRRQGLAQQTLHNLQQAVQNGAIAADQISEITRRLQTLLQSG